ncbi:PspA/IM30 family protein [Ferviditalea candida]|uniref:PspA/IM30 family protein n=1 Tax=Ferviditalea candida TaxID=3108399 RepID=A0ABU5ZJZ1_9BACL|nr:PspA/IM30 family protein [Paenibacillaceae bacterium T2]
MNRTMSMIKRMRDITLANFNDWLERSEDPVRLIDGYLLEKADHIRETEALSAQCLRHAVHLKQQFLQAEQQKEKRENQALLAVKAGEDHLARLALQEKLLHEENSKRYKELHEQAQDAADQLSLQLAQLKADYQDVCNKREYYLARLESVCLRQRMNAHRGGMGGRAAESLFRRMEERVSDMELEARSLEDVRRLGREAAMYAGTALKEALDGELERLRRKLRQEGGGV